MRFLRRTKLLRCSFCGKSQHDVKKMVAGPKIQICDECVAICVDVLSRPREGEASEPLRLDDSINPS